jgi:hypothetical protein
MFKYKRSNGQRQSCLSQVRRFESLESRHASAGNILASVDENGNLLIQEETSLAIGNEATSFVVTQLSTGKFRITGFNAGGEAHKHQWCCQWIAHCLGR